MIIIIIPAIFFTIEFNEIRPSGLIRAFNVFSVSNFVLYVIFIYYVWFKYPADKKTRQKNILMIIFLGIIGMWIWLPDKKELELLAESNTTHNNA